MKKSMNSFHVIAEKGDEDHWLEITWKNDCTLIQGKACYQAEWHRSMSSMLFEVFQHRQDDYREGCCEGD